MKGARIAVDDGSCGLGHHAFEVNQAQLDGLHTLLHVPTIISMKALAYDELFHDVEEDNNKIPFSVAALECQVILPLAFLLRWFLSKLPLHPL